MQKKNRGISNMILTILDEGGEYTTEQLAEECKKRGMLLGENEIRSVYTAVIRLSRNGKVEKNGKIYSKKSTLNGEDNDISKEYYGDDKEFMKGIKAIETEIERCKNFDWVNCSVEQLSTARKNAQKLLELSNKIQEAVEKKQ